MSDTAIPIAILHGIDAPILLFQVDGTFLTMNHAAADSLGWHADGGAKLDFISLFAPADETSPRGVLAALAKGDSPRAFVTRTRPGTGVAGVIGWTARRVEAAGPYAYIVVTGQASTPADMLGADAAADGMGLGTLINAVPVPVVVTRVSDGFIPVVSG